MTIKKMLQPMIAAYGKEIMAEEQCEKLRSLVREEYQINFEFEQFMLVLKTMDVKVLLKQESVSIVELNSMYNKAIERTGLRYALCSRYVLTILELLEVRTNENAGVFADRKDDCTAQAAAIKKPLTTDQIHVMLHEAEGLCLNTETRNDGITILNQLKKADVAEAYYRLGMMALNGGSAKELLQGEADLRAAAVRGHTEAELALADHCMRRGNFEEAERAYCAFGGAFLTRRRKSNVIFLDEIKRINLRLQVMSIVLTILCVVFSSAAIAYMDVKTAGIVFIILSSIGMLGLMGFSCYCFIRNQLKNTTWMFLVQMMLFVLSMIVFAMNMDVMK